MSDKHLLEIAQRIKAHLDAIESAHSLTETLQMDFIMSRILLDELISALTERIQKVYKL